MEWKRLSARVDSAVILHPSTGYIRRGALTAMIGPSGAGKTTLLNMLARRNTRDMEITGHVLFNGSPCSDAVAKKFCYIQQFDVLMETLTVSEALAFAIRLRLWNQSFGFQILRFT